MKMLFRNSVENVSGIWRLSFALLPIISSSFTHCPFTNYKTPSPVLFILCVRLVYACKPRVCSAYRNKKASNPLELSYM